MSSNTRFALNTWYAVALVNDGNTLTLYINGEKDNSMTVAPCEYASMECRSACLQKAINLHNYFMVD